MTLSLDDAYANARFIDGGEGYSARWSAEAAAFRAEAAKAELDQPYGAAEARHKFDIFYPKGKPQGLLIFVHGGWWHAFDKSDWSQFAQGPLARGWAVAMPSYSHAPAVSIRDITEEIACAVEAISEKIEEVPIVIAGHSAGGHLAARMGCEDVDLGQIDRVARIVPISPLADLTPLRKLKENEILQIDAFEAMEESPVTHEAPPCDVHIWIGADERPGFMDQARWLEKAWGAELTLAPGKHHFNVLDDLLDAQSALTKCVTLAE